MKRKIVRYSLIAVGTAVLAVACSESPTAPGGGAKGNVTTIAVSVTGDLAVSEGGTLQLIATATMSDGTTATVTSQATWASANAAIATVSSTGLATGRAAGVVQVTATYQGQTGNKSLQVMQPAFAMTVRAEAITAIGTCDDFTQGSDTGEFAIRVRALRSVGTPLTVSDTRDYPGNPDGPFVYTLSDNASVTLSGSETFSMIGAAGQSVTVEFNATEWDTLIVIIPPRIDNVRDSRMNNRSTSRIHAFANGAFENLGSRTLTIGDSTCGIRLNYAITATRQ